MPPLLEVRSLTKSFPGVRALREVSLTLQRGEVLAVIGENGAGKSTLMKILAGVQTQDSGTILLDGQPTAIPSTRTATELGIALIHQELNLPDNLTVAANLFLGREPRKYGFLLQREMDQRAVALLKQIGISISPQQRVESLSLGQQQMVEIAKALSTQARILIMDEPTSSLSQGETEQLYRVIRELREQGVSIIYISHRLGEVKTLADRVTVLRDGQNAGELARDEITHDRMVQLMVGREFTQFHHRNHHGTATPALEVRNLTTPAHPHSPLHFRIHAGEIVGIAGLVGAGRTELLRVLFGIDPAVQGEILIQGAPVQLLSPRDAIEAGLALVPEDRKQQGVILEMGIDHNITLPGLSRTQRAGWLNPASENQLSDQMIEQLQIKTPHRGQWAQFLSGGNQQKVVLGKWLALQPRVLLLDEPTRGIDVGAKREIYKLLENLAENGVAVLFASSEMEEVLHLSDRVLVMHQGNITGELARSELSEESIMRLATGTHNPIQTALPSSPATASN